MVVQLDVPFSQVKAGQDALLLGSSPFRFFWWVNSWRTGVAVPMQLGGRSPSSLSLPVQGLADIP